MEKYDEKYKNLIRVENGFGHPVGYFDASGHKLDERKDQPEIDLDVWWHKHRTNLNGSTTDQAYHMRVKLVQCIPFGFTLRLKWKELERLKRAGLLLPYRKRHWPCPNGNTFYA